ncbi:hypothetical protein ABT039_27830 [Streptomyces lasiicapitis]|uniref:hypothetical protein n=1 Tax=Streptomyces lasiicapitis TaxID=1923961 RepID=UPI00332707A1
MSDLTLTPESPGLHVAKPSAYAPATGSYVCGGCDAAATAHGDTAVQGLVDEYTERHGPAHRQTGGY